MRSSLAERAISGLEGEEWKVVREEAGRCCEWLGVF